MGSFLMFVFWLLYMHSTFPGTEHDFLLKLTRQPKNNLLQEGVGGKANGEIVRNRKKKQRKERDRLKERST